jgi:alkylation response protein AidB-like acyl-CoA dehydrogenase
MDLNFTAEEEAFRQEVREFFAQSLPPRFAQRTAAGLALSKPEQLEWQAILNRKGWLAPHWPVEWGGTGWSVVEKYIFDLESSLANAPMPIAFAFSMLAPVLLKYGSEVQKRHWLVPIGGAKGIQSRVPDPISPHSRHAQSATATIMSSMARRPGRPWASTRT